MALNFKELVGGVVGLAGGGRSQVTATAASAKVISGLDGFRAGLLKSAEKLGRKVAPTVGSDFFDALSRGAGPAASAARADEAGRLTGVKVDPRQAWSVIKSSPYALAVLAAGAAGLGYLVYRWVRRGS